MDKELRRHYTLIVDFLGHILGPDYEIALHELTDDANEIIAISGGELTGRHLGSPLSNRMLEFVAGHVHETRDYVLQFESVTDSGKPMRCNSMFIKDRTGNLVGLLCINFDASRYEELSRRVLDLCGGKLTALSQSGARLITDNQETLSSAQVPNYPRSIAGATARLVAEVMAQYPMDAERLTQDEKMAIMDALNRKGVFLLKGAVSYVARVLHSSEASIYRYLGKLNNR